MASRARVKVLVCSTGYVEESHAWRVFFVARKPYKTADEALRALAELHLRVFMLENGEEWPPQKKAASADLKVCCQEASLYKDALYCSKCGYMLRADRNPPEIFNEEDFAQWCTELWECPSVDWPHELCDGDAEFDPWVPLSEILKIKPTGWFEVVGVEGRGSETMLSDLAAKLFEEHLEANKT